jgi:chemotaxis protein histidine kinase CheA
MSDLTDPFPQSDNLDLIELQLQQELQAMFDIDSQRYLQDYLHLVQNLNSQSWTADMQEMYRAIHTIKGGAVTVGADACLKVATVLEDLLSDLRHLTPAPPLGDEHLTGMLQEAGELVASSLQVQGTGEAVAKFMHASVQRLQNLHIQIKATYLSDWNDQRLLHQEFADQGFGLVVLNLEMAVDRLSIPGVVPADAIEIATQTLAQLADIGIDLEFTEGWIELLGCCDALINEPSPEIWRSQWPGYISTLQQSACQGGKFIEPTFIPVSEIKPIHDSPGQGTTVESGFEGLELEDFAFESLELDLPVLDSLDSDTFSPMSLDLDEIDLSGLDDFMPSSAPEEPDTFEQRDEFISTIEVEPVRASADFQSGPETVETLAVQGNWSELDDLSGLDEFSELESLDLKDLEDLPNFAEFSAFGKPPEIASDTTFIESESTDDWLGLVSPDPTQVQEEVTAIQRDRRAGFEQNNLQIPVPLERLDRTAQTLVETLLSVRASQGLYQNLQSQLTQLLVLAQDSAQYITELRKLQDSYALLNDLTANRQSGDSPTLERYRQGYSTINRLLETSLRLSELGAEANKSAQQTANSLKTLDRNVLNLRQNVEQSRLVPFKNLGFRAKAVLRDLTTRIGKPAQMIVEGDRIELDASTASKLEPALLHLIRNAYDHGLESATDRVTSGKPEQGTITLSLRRSGSRYLVELKDDGQGIDADRIRQIAEAKGLPLTRTETNSQLLAVICQPGFSSQSVVSDISGRGVGMDVVAHQIETLGGRLRLETSVGQGSTFQLQFPVPQLLVSCVMLQVGDHTFAIPAQDVATTALWDSLQTIPAEGPNRLYSWQIQQGETCMPGLDLLRYWQPQSTARSIPDTAIAMQIRATDQEKSLWILADDLIGQTELLISSLPSPMESPMGVLGVSLQTDGSLVPVIDASMLAEILSQPQAEEPTILAPQLTANLEPPAIEVLPQSTRTILVVDDAALMRRRIEASLAAYGYTIVTCSDGQEAWNWLQSHTAPAMVITDIEMPNMDGFTLIDKARQFGITIPMVVVSSRLAEEWSKEAQRLGATDYITKGFTTQELVSKVKSLL